MSTLAMHQVWAATLPKRCWRRAIRSLEGLEEKSSLGWSCSKSRRRRGAGDARCRGETWPICKSSSELGSSGCEPAAKIMESSLPAMTMSSSAVSEERGEISDNSASSSRFNRFTLACGRLSLSESRTWGSDSLRWRRGVVGDTASSALARLCNCH